MKLHCINFNKVSDQIFICLIFFVVGSSFRNETDLNVLFKLLDAVAPFVAGVVDVAAVDIC